MDLRELGALLKAERERQGISVNEITDQIKISRTALIAIEEGDESKLPHSVYAKGFIKNYARLLNLDAEEVSQTLAVAFDEEEDAAMRPAYQESRETVTSIKTGAGGTKKSSSFGLVLLLLLLLAGGALWYFYFLAPKASLTDNEAVSKTESVAEPAAPASAPDVAQPETAPPVAEQSPPADTTANTLDGPTDSSASLPTDSQDLQTSDSLDGQQATAGEPSVSEQALGSEIPETPPADQPSLSQPADSAQPEASVEKPENEGLPVSDSEASGNHMILGDGPNVVDITAKELCWLEAAVDGGAMNETTLQKGQSLTGRFEDVLLVRLGNAGGVEIRFNGKPYAFEGANGQVKTLKFTTKKAETPPAVAPEGTNAPETSAAAPAAPVAPDASVATGEKILEAYGADGSWMIIIADGKKSKEVFVKKGERMTFPFEKNIEVRLGNPSNLVFTYDGKEYPASSERGETKTLHFPKGQ